MNTNSNTYTIIYASVMVIIVAFLLAFVSSALKPMQDANVAIDKKSQILASLNIRDLEKSEIEAKYDAVITCDPIIKADGAVVNEGAAKDEASFVLDSKDVNDENMPLYIAVVFGATSLSTTIARVCMAHICHTPARQQVWVHCSLNLGSTTVSSAKNSLRKMAAKWLLQLLSQAL